MIDLSTESLLSMAQAARLRPLSRRGRPTHPSTIYRWIARGLRGHRLEGIRLGGSLYTSREALQRFADALTVEVVQTPPTGASHAESVDAELNRLGF